MDLTVLMALLDDPLPWVIAVLTLGGMAMAIFGLLWFFRVTRLIMTKNIPCPEQRRWATVELIVRVGELGRYREVRSCSLQKEDKGFTCGKACLTSPQVLQAPLIGLRKEQTLWVKPL
jgi:hypothetical protein